MSADPSVKVTADDHAKFDAYCHSVNIKYFRYKQSYRQVKLSGNNTKAVSCLKKAIQELEGYRDCSAGNFALINFLVELGDYPTARRRLAEAEEAGHLGQDGVQRFVGVQSEVFQTDQQIDKFRTAFNLCLLVRDFEKAWTYYERLVAVKPGYFTENATHERLFYRGLMYYGLHRYEEAFDSLIKAAELAEAQRALIAAPEKRSDSFGTYDTGSIFPYLALVCIESAMTVESKEAQQEWWDRTLCYLEQGKARFLLDLLSHRTSSPASQERVPVLQETTERLLRELLSTSEPHDEDSRLFRETRLKQLHKAKDAQESQHLLEPLVSSALHNFSIPTACGSLETDTAVVELAVCDSGTMIVIAMNSGVEFATIVPLETIAVQRLVSEFRQAMPKSDEYNNAKSAADRQRALQAPAKDRQNSIRALSEHLIKPIQGYIRGKRHLIFIPSASLQDFPFSVLTFDAAPLLLNFAVSTAPSLMTLHLLSKSTRTPPSPPSIAAIVDSGVGESSIPYAAAEGLFAAHVLRSWPTWPQIADFSIQNTLDLMQKELGIIHLACHGEFDTSRPLRSSLQLGAPLYALDFANFTCRASLVVFSACLSARGRLTFAGDLHGFSHLVLASGAQAFLGALWEVSDAISLLQMFLFYRAVAADPGARLVDLLRAVQLELFYLDDEKLQGLKTDFLAIWDSLGQEESCRARRARILPDGRSQLERLWDQLPLNFRDAWCWSPYVLVGCGDIPLF